MSTGPVVPKELRDAIRAEMLELKAAGESQVSIGVKIGMAQVTVGKAMNTGQLGQDVAAAFLRAYRLDPEELIRKHDTRTTAADVVSVLENYEDLTKTIKADSARWGADRLLELVAEVKRHPPNCAAGGRLIVGTWRQMLDDVGREPKVIRTVERFGKRRTRGV